MSAVFPEQGVMKSETGTRDRTSAEDQEGLASLIRISRRTWPSRVRAMGFSYTPAASQEEGGPPPWHSSDSKSDASDQDVVPDPFVLDQVLPDTLVEVGGGVSWLSQDFAANVSGLNVTSSSSSSRNHSVLLREWLEENEVNETAGRMAWNNSDLSFGGGAAAVFPSYIVTVSTAVLAVLLVVGVIGNVLIPLVIWRQRDMRSSTNLLLVNLAFADLAVLLVSLPTALTELHSQPETWVLGAAMCKLVPFVEWSVSHASVLTILVISLERYYAICRPLRASYTCTKMRACTCILIIWAAAVVVSSPMLHISQHSLAPYYDGTNVNVCVSNGTTIWASVYYNVVTFVFFFVPLIVLFVLYVVIGRRLMLDSASATLNRKTTDIPNMKARKQVVVMLATVAVFFFVCLMPFRVLTIWVIWTPQEKVHSIGAVRFYTLLYTARVMLFINSAVNPILYNVTSSKFREAFIKLHCGDGNKQRLSRQSTFNTTGTSFSNGKTGSSRITHYDDSPRGSFRYPGLSTSATSGYAFGGHLQRPRYGRQSSFDSLRRDSNGCLRYEMLSRVGGTTVGYLRQASRNHQDFSPSAVPSSSSSSSPCSHKRTARSTSSSIRQLRRGSGTATIEEKQEQPEEREEKGEKREGRTGEEEKAVDEKVGEGRGGGGEGTGEGGRIRGKERGGEGGDGTREEGRIAGRREDRGGEGKERGIRALDNIDIEKRDTCTSFL